MALSKFSINAIFACVVMMLALTAATFLYVNSDHQARPPAGATGAMPENRPPIDAAERVAALEQLSATYPQNPEYPTQIANLYYDLGQYDKAVEFYERSLRLRPQDPNVETDLAVCFHYIGNHDKALETLDRVIAYSPGFVQALFNKGAILVNGKKDVKGGVAVWEDLLRTHPDYPQRSELEQRLSQLKGSGQ